jgi:chromosomal replication initiator protein
METAINLWQKALEYLKDEIGTQAFETWLRPVRLASATASRIVLEAPDNFIKEWLQERYFELISNAMKKVSGESIHLEISASPTTYKTDVENTRSFIHRQSPRPMDGLHLNSRYTFDSFVIGASNRFAHAAATAVAESPAKAYNPLFVYGGVGLGKTHLMQAIGNFIVSGSPKTKVIYLSSEEFMNQLINAIQTRNTSRFRDKYRNVDILLIDDIHFIAGKESTQEEFFHTFNTLYDSHRQIVISSDRPPKEIASLENRLVSRFQWGLVADIQAPDLETRIAILRKKIERESVTIPDDVIPFIASEIKTNIRELEGALIRVVAYAALNGEKISLKLASELLKPSIAVLHHSQISVERIQQRVAEHFCIRAAEIRARRRSQSIMQARHLAIYLTRSLTNLSLPDIGSQFGGRNHTTVLHAYQKIRKAAEHDAVLRQTINKLRTDIQANA